MDLVNLTETIIKKLVSDPDNVSVKEFETEEENTIQIEVLISADDNMLILDLSIFKSFIEFINPS